MAMSVITILAAVLAVPAAVLAFIFIIPEKKRARMNKFGKFLHDLCNFKFLIVEKIFQFCYVLSTAYCLITGFFGLFAVEEVWHSGGRYYDSYYSTEWVGYQGLLILILGPIAVRIAYELIMLVLIAIKNIIQINNKLKNQNEGESVDPFATPEMPFAPAAPAVVTCPNCGAPKNPNEFCANCGTR